MDDDGAEFSGSHVRGALGDAPAGIDYDMDMDSDDYPIEALDDENDAQYDPLGTDDTDDSSSNEKEAGNGTAGENSSKDNLFQNLSLGTDDSNEAENGGAGESSEKDNLSRNLSLCAAFFKRKFVGETSGGKFASEILYGNTVKDILKGVWRIIKPVIRQEVVFEEDGGTQVATWAGSEPTFADIGKFVYLQNQANRRRIDVDKLDSKLLISWRSKEIRIHVHIYSTTVSCKQLWEVMDRQLVRFQDTDRAGAPNNQSLTALANQLRDIHGTHFNGHASSWKIWANYIHSSPAHERERRMNELPPHSIIKFFRSVPISEAVRLESTRNGLTVATTINEAFSVDLDNLENQVDGLILSGQRIKHQITAMRARCSTNSSIVSAMQDSIKPHEDEVSVSLAENVSEMNDVDHA